MTAIRAETAPDSTGITHAWDPDSDAHHNWLIEQGRFLLAFPQAPIPEGGGFYWLDDFGAADRSKPVFTWVSARMAHVYYLAVLAGEHGASGRAKACLDGLSNRLLDSRFGGWYEESPPEHGGAKLAYSHAFVLLAASTATLAGSDTGAALMDRALDVIGSRFWDDRVGLSSDEWDRAWTRQSEYRGLNANMHMTEAFLAAATAGKRELFEQAIAICERVISWASEFDWRIPEHFDAAWRPLPDYNLERPADAFKPYGSTPGHGFEWARLIAQASLAAPSYKRASLREAANEIYDRARTDAWCRTGYDGFAYTVDWHGRPVIDLHLAWVAAEATAAADALRRITGRKDAARDYLLWWEHIAATYIDVQKGSWIHELSAENTRSSTLWVGKPDLYHAYQATVLPRYAPSTSVAGSVVDLGNA